MRIGMLQGMMAHRGFEEVWQGDRAGLAQRNSCGYTSMLPDVQLNECPKCHRQYLLTVRYV